MNFSSKYTLPVAALVITVLTAGHYALNLNGQLHFFQMYTTPNFEATGRFVPSSSVASSSSGVPLCTVGLVCCNGVVDTIIGEECDDGNLTNGDGCEFCRWVPISSSSSSSVSMPYCGDGSIDSGEQCDDGNTTSVDGCSNTCQFEIFACGNGIIEPGEECDDSNVASGDGCNNTCQYEVPACGNGMIELGEECDDWNTTSGDGCSSTCMWEYVCGNTFTEPGEQCDDGNTTSGDGCSSTCQNEPLPVCGNTIVETGEQCDDGNTTSRDGCSSSCRTEGSISAECVHAASGFTCAGAASNTQPVIDSCVNNARTLCLTHPGGIFNDFAGTYSYSGFFPSCTAEQTVWYTCDW